MKIDLGNRQKSALIILFGAAILFLLNTTFFSPLRKENRGLYDEYKQLDKKVKGMERFSEDEVNNIQKKLEESSIDLDKRIPPVSKRLDIMGQLTRVSKGATISFSQISQRAAKEENGYRVASVDITSRSNLFDFLKYLEEVDKGPLLVTVDNLNIRKAERESDILIISAAFSGYQVTRPLSPASEYLKEDSMPDSLYKVDKLLEPIKLERKTPDLSFLKESDPFTSRAILRPHIEEAGVSASVETTAEELNFKGIAQVNDDKAALINNLVVKEGDEIVGMRVLEIQRFKVVLSKQGKKYILELGKKGLKELE